MHTGDRARAAAKRPGPFPFLTSAGAGLKFRPEFPDDPSPDGWLDAGRRSADRVDSKPRIGREAGGRGSSS